VRQGEIVAEVDREPVRAPFDGALRGLLHDGVHVTRGMKLGDLDPRREASYSRQISDKALAVGGAVLEAILSRPELRRALAG
jgi:xanthine dehydrogenase accessory factor